MALPGQHAESAMEHLISALRDEGVIVRNYSRGYGAMPGMEYTRPGALDVAAFDPHNDGLEISEDASPRLAGLIRSHCALYCGLYKSHS